jgi:hypothetical protein
LVKRPGVIGHIQGDAERGFEDGGYAFLTPTEGAGRATGTQVAIYDFGVDPK